MNRDLLKVLYLTPSVPYPPHTGGQIRSLYLLRYFASKGTVSLVTLGRPEQYEPYEQDLRKYCKDIYFANTQKFVSTKSLLRSWLLDDFVDAEILKQIELAKPETYDIIVCRFAVMAYYFLTQKKYRHLLNRLVIDIDDLSMLVQERTIKAMPFGYRKFRSSLDVFLLKRYYQQLNWARACFVVSEKDRVYVNQNHINKETFVIPNVFEVNGRTAGSFGEARNPEILFCGMMSYPPNREAVNYFANDIFPKIREQIPNAHFTIVGKNMPEETKQLSAKPGITVAGYVPSMEPYYQEAALVVVPLLNGGGTRIKILEAFSYERAVVSTSVGAEGLDVANGENIVIADDPNDFAEECIELLVNASKRKFIALNGYQLVKEKYDVPVFRKKMDEVFEFVQKR